jgi:hypothetical protein
MIEIYCAYDAVVDIDTLKPNPANPNKHPPAQIDLLAKIIGAQGFRNPIVVSNRSGLITKGHARLEAARKLGIKMLPIDRQDYASDSEELADMIADNRIAELAEADRSMLRELLGQLDDGAFDTDLTGFDALALEELMTAAPPEQGENDPNAEWIGMPEFLNHPKAHRSLIVHFKTLEDLSDFLERIEQQITDQTKCIWHPKAERQDLSKIAFVSESE